MFISSQNKSFAETPAFAVAAGQGSTTARNIFTVTGHVHIHNIYARVVTAITGGASTNLGWRLYGFAGPFTSPPLASPIPIGAASCGAVLDAAGLAPFVLPPSSGAPATNALDVNQVLYFFDDTIIVERYVTGAGAVTGGTIKFYATYTPLTANARMAGI